MSPEIEAIGTLERVLALKKLPAFADLHPTDLAPLAARAIPRRLPADAALPLAAEGGSMHLLIEGCVRAHGETRDAPAVLGLIELLAGKAPPPLRTTAASLTLEIGRRALVEVLEDEFDVWLATLRHVCAHALERGVPRPTDAFDPRGADLGDLAERIALLRRIPPFAGLGIHALGQIASEMEPIAADAGATLWSAGDAAGHVLVIASGVVHCDGGDGAVRDVGAGTLLGLAEALCVDRRSYRAEARSAVRALRLDTEALIDVLEDDPDAGVELIRVIARGAAGGGDDDDR
jgi:hypothetical protein